MTQDPSASASVQATATALPPAALAERLIGGAVALMPTDTLPALAARPAFASRIWGLKQRPLEKPLILMGADLAQLEPVLGRPWRAEWLAIAAQGWPGPLTLVLPAIGSLVAQHLAWQGLLDGELKFRPMTLPDRFLDHAAPKVQYDWAGLNARHIVATALAALGAPVAQPARA